jgi:hypothetical protein
MRDSERLFTSLIYRVDAKNQAHGPPTNPTSDIALIPHLQEVSFTPPQGDFIPPEDDDDSCSNFTATAESMIRQLNRNYDRNILMSRVGQLETIPAGDPADITDVEEYLLGQSIREAVIAAGQSVNPDGGYESFPEMGELENLPPSVSQEDLTPDEPGETRGVVWVKRSLNSPESGVYQYSSPLYA